MLRRLVALIVVSITSVSVSYAQTEGGRIDAALAREIARADWAQPATLRVVARPLDIEPRTLPALNTRLESTQATSAAPQTSERSWGWKLLGGALGGVGGFFAGGYLGAWLEPDCHCDDPGLKGALIGAPIGAVVGAIVGVKVF